MQKCHWVIGRLPSLSHLQVTVVTDWQVLEVLWAVYRAIDQTAGTSNEKYWWKKWEKAFMLILMSWNIYWCGVVLTGLSWWIYTWILSKMLSRPHLKMCWYFTSKGEKTVCNKIWWFWHFSKMFDLIWILPYLIMYLMYADDVLWNKTIGHAMQFIRFVIHCIKSILTTFVSNELSQSE